MEALANWSASVSLILILVLSDIASFMSVSALIVCSVIF